MKHLRKFNESIEIDKHYFVELEESGLCNIEYWGNNKVEFIFTTKVDVKDSINSFDLDSRLELNDSKTEFYTLIKKCVDTLSYDYKVYITEGNDNKFIISLYSKEDVEEYFKLDDDTITISKSKISRMYPNINMTSFNYREHWISFKYKNGSKVSKDDMYGLDLISKIPGCGSRITDDKALFGGVIYTILIDSSKYKFSIVD